MLFELREKNVRAMDALELSIEQEPSHVPDEVIAEIRGRERNGAIELPKSKLKAGDRAQRGPCASAHVTSACHQP